MPKKDMDVAFRKKDAIQKLAVSLQKRKKIQALLREYGDTQKFLSVPIQILLPFLSIHFITASKRSIGTRIPSAPGHKTKWELRILSV